MPIIDNTERREAMWSGQYVLQLVVSFLVSTSHYMLMTTLPLYVMKTSGNNTIGGLMVSLLTLSALLFRPVFGNMMDRRGRKVVLVTGAAVLMVVVLLYNLVVAISLLLILRFVQGIGFSAHTTSSGTIVADIVPPSRISEGIGIYGMANTIATAVGPAIGLAIIDARGYPLLFLSAFLLSFLSFISTLFVNYEKKRGKGAAADTAGRSEGRREPFFESTSIRPALFMLFIAITFGAIITYIPALGAARKIGNIGTFFTAYAVAVVAARSFTGRIADKHGFTMIMVLGLISMGASLAVLAFGATLPVILAGGALYGFGYGITFPLMNAIAVKLCPGSRRGAATGTIFAAMDIGIGLGAFLWGWVSELSGFTAVYLLAGACILVCGWIFHALIRRRIPGELRAKSAGIPS